MTVILNFNYELRQLLTRNFDGNIDQLFPTIHPFQTDPGRHRTDLGLQLWGGQRGRQSAALLLRFHRVPWQAAVSHRHLGFHPTADPPTLYNPAFPSAVMFPFFRKRRKKKKHHFLFLSTTGILYFVINKNTVYLVEVNIFVLSVFNGLEYIYICLHLFNKTKSKLAWIKYHKYCKI